MVVTKPRRLFSHGAGRIPSGETLSVPRARQRPAALHHASIALPFRPVRGPGLPNRMSKTSLDKSKIRFLLLEGVHPSAVQVLRDAGYSQIETLPKALQGEELK